MENFKEEEIEPILCELADVIEYVAENEFEPMELEEAPQPVQQQPEQEEPKPGPSRDSEVYYDVLNHSARQIKKFSTDCNEIVLKLRVPEQNINFNSYLKNAFNKMIEEFIHPGSTRNRVGLTFKNETITKPVYVSYRSPTQISADAILDQFERIIQSNQSINLQEPLEVKITNIKMPEGYNPRRKYNLTDFDKFCKSKRAFITINNTDDNLCLPRALIVGKALAHREENEVARKYFRKISRSDRQNDAQKKEAINLCRAAGVDINRIGGGINALQIFQDYLSDYKITVFDGTDRDGHTITYKGNQSSRTEKYIDLILYNQHYNVITSPQGAFRYEFYCRACYTLYNHKGSHRCGMSCTQCLQTPPCNPAGQHIDCERCNRYFYGRECYENHLQPRFEKSKSVCDTLKYCKSCKKIYSMKNQGKEKHRCDHHVCRSCDKYVPYDHLCYIQPVKTKKKKNINLFVFFDFETRTEDLPCPSTSKYLSYKHIPNYCVIQLQCDKCIEDDDIRQPCVMCGQREYKIGQVEGDYLLDEFFKIIQEKSPNFDKIYLWAHNGGGYDFIFLAEYMLRTRKWTPEFTMNGGKILIMKYEKLTFKDSLNFFHTKLAALPKMFGLEDSKGTFPHRFNRPQNYNYIGKIPSEDYYGIHEMTTSEREKFLEWYKDQKENETIFDFQKEMEKYCTKDVEILRKACLKFRKMFIDLLKVDPLTESSTIASACMRAFRSNFLKENSIALMPFKNYRMKENQSPLAVRYIRFFEDKYNVQLESTYRGFEKKIGKYYIDAYHQAFQMEKLDPKDKSIRPLILEINGCYYHGCPKCFPNRTAMIKKNKKRYLNMDMKYQNTKNKIEYLRNLKEHPYIIEKWECEIYKDATTDPNLKKYLEDEKLITPILSNREAFFGGRTENFKRYYKVDETKGEKIRYLDVNSLYPFVNKYGTYPVGHPKVLIGNDIPPTLDGLTGVAKVKILPPKNLYIPLLPVKIDSKLSFTLCPTCTLNKNMSNCEHTDNERTILGTYTIKELQKAQEVGYKIVEIFEVWSYDSTKYDKITGQGGLFADYVNLFLKIKQEASGFPHHITTQEEKQKFIEDLREREGVQLDISKIQPNPGLRSLSKLCLNSVDVREKDFNRAEKWWEENVLNNRAYFEVNSHSANLVIDHVVEKDAAMYRCRVDFKYAQTRNSKVNLTIVVPPQKITILDEQNAPRSTIVGPYPENADLTLICQVFGGKPWPHVMWYKNAVLLSNVTVNATRKEGLEYVESAVSLKRLQRSDLHSQLTCAASNTHLKGPLTAVVQVDMNFRPLDVRIVPEEQPLTAQRKYELVCESTGSRPPAKLTWWKNNRRLEKTKDTISADGNTTRSMLTYIPAKEDKNKYLCCKAENPVIAGGKVLEAGWKLKIHYTPEAKIILGTSLKQDSIKEGMDVYFDCIVNAFPPIYKVEWRKNNKPLQQMKNVIISNQSLVLQSVTRTSAGNYTCIGYNSEGDGISDPFYLNVMYAPFCKPNQTRVYGIAKNELVNITCEVEANPLDLTFRWKFNNSAENEDLPPMITKPGSTISVVSHMPVLEVDYGTLLCSATNKVGRQRIPCVFHVIATGRPDPVSNCSVNNISLNSFSVRCVEGFNGGLPQTFSILVTEPYESQVINISSTTPWFTVSGLQPGTLYTVSVYSTNAKGHSEPYQLEVLTQGKRLQQTNGNIGEIPPEKRQGNFHVTATMSIIIGAVISLLTIGCIVISVFKIQCAKSRPSFKNRNHKTRTSNGNLTATDKNFSSPIHSEEVSASVCPSLDIDSDDKNPDIIPQPTGEIDRLSDSSRKKQHISTIESRYMQNRNFLQYGNSTPTGYSGYCTLRTGIVPLQDFCHINTKTTSIHGDLQYLSSSGGTLNRHQWPTYSGAVAGVQSHQCAYQTLPNPTHQQAQTQTHTAPMETSLPNTSLVINKQESTV